jgi:radical SAM superfamily enzyme YgiQ (UPF0313 family)
MCFTRQTLWTIELAEKIKIINKKIFILAGGGMIRNSLGGIFRIEPKNLKFFDAFIVGDGEEPLKQLIYNIANKKDLAFVPNLIFRDIKTSSFSHTKKIFSASKKLLHTKPSFKNINTSFFIPIRASLGCYWGQCAFCYHSINKKNKFEVADPKKIVSIIKKLKEKNHQKKFFFYDDSLPPLYLKKLAETLIKEKVAINWGIRGGCVDDAFLNIKLLKLLKKSGCSFINFGAESFSDNVLILMRKMHKTEKIIKIIKPIKKEGIRVVLYMLFGFPGEKIEDIRLTLSMLKKYRNLYNHIIANYFQLDSDSYVYQNYQKFNIKIVDTAYPRFPKTENGAISLGLIKRLIKEYGLEKKLTFNSSDKLIL